MIGSGTPKSQSRAPRPKPMFASFLITAVGLITDEQRRRFLWRHGNVVPNVALITVSRTLAMARSVSGLNAITDFIRRNPRTSAIAAFNIGLYAATIARRGVKPGEFAELPARLVGLVPSMRDLMSLLSDQDEVPPVKRRSTRGKTKKRATRRRSRGTGNGGER